MRISRVNALLYCVDDKSKLDPATRKTICKEMIPVQRRRQYVILMA